MSLSTWSRLGDDLKLDLQAVTNRDLKGQDWKTSNRKTAAAEINLVVSNSVQHCGLQPARLLCPQGSLGKNTGVDCHDLTPGDLPYPGIKPRSPVLQAEPLPLSHQESPTGKLGKSYVDGVLRTTGSVDLFMSYLNPLHRISVAEEALNIIKWTKGHIPQLSVSLFPWPPWFKWVHVARMKIICTVNKALLSTS